MSRQKQGIRLPHALQKELGLDDGPTGKKRNGFKDARKERREEKHRQKMRGVQKHEKPQRQRRARRAEYEESKDEKELKAPPFRSQPTSQLARAAPAPKSILKKPPPPRRAPSPSPSSPDVDSDTGSEASPISSRASSPGLVLDANSRSFRDRQDEEDAEIVALEKRLGMKKGKMPGSLDEDGFGDMLGGSDEDIEVKKRKREDREWIEKKRRKAEPILDSDHDTNDGDGMLEEDDLGYGVDEVLEGAMLSDESLDGVSDEDDFPGFELEAHLPPQQKVRENPYVAPVPASSSTTKYIPPSLRKFQSFEGQDHDRLRKQLQGHLNKLSEANLISILNEVETIYQTNPRQNVTTVLIDLLLSLFCNPSSLQNTFVILHAVFMTAIYKVVGTDFGAEILSQLVDRFGEYHDSDTDGKESLNLLSLLSNLFIFNMVSSPIIYDHIHLLLKTLTESNTELLLRLIRDCGPQLRSDDPAALKSIVSQTQSAAKALESSTQDVSVRTRFMIETIMDLKNNKMRDFAATSSMTKEHITRMRKVLGSLNSRSLRATEPLRISLSDLQNSDRKGKWWLVGASWKGNDSIGTLDEHQDQALNPSITSDFAMLIPKDFGLTTPLQQLIFAAISTSESYIDAHARLTKLRLKRSQEPEIARVLLRLCGSEKAYNPFYAHVAKRLCSIEGGKRMRKTFDFALWGFFRRLGERAEDDEDAEILDQEVSVEEINNVAHLYASLMHWGLVSLAVFRVLDLAYLKENAQLFVEMMLVRVLLLCEGREGAVETVFEKAAEAKQVVPRLKLFLRKHVRNSDLVGSKQEREAVKQGYKVTRKVLEQIGRMSEG